MEIKYVTNAMLASAFIQCVTFLNTRIDDIEEDSDMYDLDLENLLHVVEEIAEDGWEFPENIQDKIEFIKKYTDIIIMEMAVRFFQTYHPSN